MKQNSSVGVKVAVSVTMFVVALLVGLLVMVLTNLIGSTGVLSCSHNQTCDDKVRPSTSIKSCEGVCMNDAFRQPLRYILIGSAVLLVIVVALTPVFNSYSKKHVMVTTVCSKEGIYNGDGNEYRVYTTNGTFVVKDHVINGIRTTSADTYGRIQSNTTYKIEYYGWRIGILHKFKNILTVAKVPEDEQRRDSC